MIKSEIGDELTMDAKPQKISLMIDNCVWNKFYELNLDLSKELPFTNFTLYMTKEVAEFEVQAMSSNVKKQHLHQYIEKQINNCPIKTDSFFGLSSYQTPAGYKHRSGGFNEGRWLTYAEVPAVLKYEKEIDKTKLRPTDLYCDEADASLAIRSITGFVVLTAEKKKKKKEKEGPLQKAYKDGGKIVFWDDFDVNNERLMDFIIRQSK